MELKVAHLRKAGKLEMLKIALNPRTPPRALCARRTPLRRDPPVEHSVEAAAEREAEGAHARPHVLLGEWRQQVPPTLQPLLPRTVPRLFLGGRRWLDGGVGRG